MMIDGRDSRRRSFGPLRALASAVALSAWLAACALPDPPQPTSPQPTRLPLLAISPAPTLDSVATATVLARPVTPTLDAAAAATATQPPSATPEEPARYTVQRGDTLAAIASRFGTTVDEIVALNGLADPNSIEVGQQLLMPAAGGEAAP